MSAIDLAGAPSPAHRRTSRTAGILYLLTFVSIPTVVLYGPVKATGSVLGSGPDTPGYLAVMFDGAGQYGLVAGLSALPVAVFEFSFGVWLLARGFDPRAVAGLEARTAGEGIPSAARR